ALYQEVRHDLKKNAKTYKSIMDIVGQGDTVLHVSGHTGQLDFLLILDSYDRHIVRYVPDPHLRSILKNSFLTQNHHNLQIVDSPDEVLSQKANVLIFDTGTVDIMRLQAKIKDEITILIVLNSLSENELQNIKEYGFRPCYENGDFRILKKADLDEGAL